MLTPYDVVISNAWRPNDSENLKRSLSRCKVHFFDLPEDDEEKRSRFIKQTDIDLYGKERATELALAEFNRNANEKSEAGFDLAETIFTSPGTDNTRPGFILFAAKTARVARSLCNYTITNSGDVLLNSIVSILEQKHAYRLVRRHKKEDQPTSDASSGS